MFMYEVSYSIKSAGQRLPDWKNHIAQYSLALIGYQGEVFDVELQLFKTEERRFNARRSCINNRPISIY